jgi:hypothetical protein
MSAEPVYFRFVLLGNNVLKDTAIRIQNGSAERIRYMVRGRSPKPETVEPISGTDFISAPLASAWAVY